ncbi:TlpA disulfide reductase family protein [Blastococcus mobilis]|uniref:Thiol-disulfide isomerase or thioredoxin n=1 Tax=Blastococcus mobilis TaxID=1938746 RepID=A0A238VUY1_9ACTN|nr:TlpA disulfide reductase family protein [Blastococcus mobilis]SNR38125.1 Thiol-disulfide isomerase or thioredoxin [Blastococcus mobilis]
MRRLLAGLTAAVLLSACAADTENPDGPVQMESTLSACPEQPGEPARGAALMPALAFDCPGGGTLDLSRAPGVPTVVNLWGSWCAPCREELPMFQELANSAGEQVHVIGVISKDGVPQAESFASDAGVVFPSAFDGEGELMAELGINVLPHTYFLDAGGALVHTQVGPVASADELRGLVAEHLGVQL